MPVIGGEAAKSHLAKRSRESKDDARFGHKKAASGGVFVNGHCACERNGQHPERSYPFAFEAFVGSA